jgi:hypothetical protein
MLINSTGKIVLREKEKICVFRSNLLNEGADNVSGLTFDNTQAKIAHQ